MRLVSGDKRTQQWYCDDTRPPRIRYILAVAVLLRHLANTLESLLQDKTRQTRIHCIFAAELLNSC